MTSAPTPPIERVFKPDNMAALGWIAASVVTASAMTIAVRQMTLELDSRMVVLVRFALTTAILVAAIGVMPRLRKTVRFSKPGLHMRRGLFMAISTHLGFFAIARIDLVTVTVLFFTAPIFAVVLSVILNGERTGPRRIAAMAVGFMGVLIILRPGSAPLEWGMLAALASSLFFAAALVQSRRLADIDGAFSTLLSTVTITTVFSIPLALPVWQVPGASATWIAITVTVLAGTMRMISDIQAYRLGEASFVGPFTYLRVILIGVAAYVMFGEFPDIWAIAGAIIIVAATIYIAQREAAQKSATKVGPLP